MRRQALAWVAWTIVLTGIVVWTLSHVNWYRAPIYRMSAPIAHARREERMLYAWPQGNISPNGPKEDLVALRGIGKVLSAAIQAEREQNGAFVYPEDLLNVKGIGEKVLHSFWEQLCLPQPDTNQ